MENNLKTAIFYTCGVCNLRCRYCGIDKNPVLKDIDKALEESFKGDYYFERVKKFFPNRGQLRRIETWGGEPFLRMERIHPLLHKIIEHYPYFDEMYSSTNFSYDTWIDQFFGLMDVFGDYPYRDFTYELQLSADGPEWLNDANRGEGVTARCLQNFYKLITELKKGRLPDNVTLNICIKATLDTDNLYRLNSKEKLIEYFSWFEDNFITPFQEAELPDSIRFFSAHPNTAVPSPVTKADGEMFANVCRLCREIEEEHPFRYYNEITIFANDITQNQLTYRYNYHTCGTGDTMVGFLPDNMLSTCHEGFTHFIEEYKKLAATSSRVETSSVNFDEFLLEQNLPFCVDEAGFMEHCRKMKMYNNNGTTSRLASIATEIVSLALAGQVDERFLDPEEALKGAIFFQGHTSYCIKDNYNQTGSYTTVPHGLLKLLLNGAMDYIQHDGELRLKGCECCNGCTDCR